MGFLIPLIISFAIRTALLLLILWIMIKLQKLDYAFLPLLGAAALACVLDPIPYFGHYLAVPVLYLCIWKITRASLFPDAVFTVVISYALVFAVNMLWLTAMIGDLRPSAAADDQPEPPLVAVTNKAAPAAVRPPPAATASVPATASASPKNQPATAASPAPATNSVDLLLKDVVVKGVTKNGDKSMIAVKINGKMYTLSEDEQTEVLLVNGLGHMRLVRLTEGWATVEVNGQPGNLRIR